MVKLQILTELEHSGVGRNKEQSARMLGHLVANAPRLIRPYMEPVLKALIPKLKDPDPNPAVVISVLATIGELAQVSGMEMRKWMDELFPIIIDTLQDSSSLAKRQVCYNSESEDIILLEPVELNPQMAKPAGPFPTRLATSLQCSGPPFPAQKALTTLAETISFTGSTMDPRATGGKYGLGGCPLSPIPCLA
uniref:Uncharacterized protein n=1 Tax=Eptatretus burgeri TaxID=7764 RepID=A0A8C4QH21_EPTBU